MELLTLFAIALGLSFDTFAVSLTCGILQTRIRFFEAVKIAVIMALFQGGLPVAGYFLGSAFASYVEPVDHWIAFGLLSVMGIRMIYEAVIRRDKREQIDITKPLILFTMALSTSIDAFVVGLGLGFVGVNIWISALAIGGITFIASMVAIRIGKKLGSRTGSRVEFAGGLILIAIGLKILIEHSIA